MNLPLPLASYLSQQENLPPMACEGQLFQLKREEFEVKLCLGHDNSLQLMQLQGLGHAEHQFVQAWLKAVLSMNRHQLSSKLLAFNAREVENFLRLDRHKPLWPLLSIPPEILELDRQVRSLWVELKLVHIQRQNGDVLKKAETYSDRIRALKIIGKELSSFFQQHLTMDLVALERADDHEQAVIAFEPSAGVLEMISENQFLKMLEDMRVFPNLKWVAEPRELP